MAKKKTKGKKKQKDGLKDRVVVLKDKPEKLFAELLLYSDSMKPETEQEFSTKVGSVTILKGKKRLTFKHENNSISKVELIKLCEGDKKQKKKPKQKDINKEAKQKLLLTLKQLEETKYKTKDLLQAIKESKSNNKKYLKSLKKELKDKKKMKGQQILDVMQPIFKNIQTHHFFEIFEIMER